MGLAWRIGFALSQILLEFGIDLSGIMQESGVIPEIAHLEFRSQLARSAGDIKQVVGQTMPFVIFIRGVSV
jgi:hypothetical protein